MGIMVYSLLWVMQDFVHQQYPSDDGSWLGFSREPTECPFGAPGLIRLLLQSEQFKPISS